MDKPSSSTNSRVLEVFKAQGVIDDIFFDCILLDICSDISYITLPAIQRIFPAELPELVEPEPFAVSTGAVDSLGMIALEVQVETHGRQSPSMLLLFHVIESSVVAPVLLGHNFLAPAQAWIPSIAEGICFEYPISSLFNTELRIALEVSQARQQTTVGPPTPPNP
jgi:hypothetical protein